MTFSRLFTALMLVSIVSFPVYAKNDKHEGSLPPGLQKKAAHGEPLPPGWQKKLSKGEIMERRVYERSEIVVPVDKKGLLTVRIEGKLVKLYEATREIVEVLD